MLFSLVKAHSLCGIGSWGGRCRSMGDHVTGPGPRGGRPPREGGNVGYALAPLLALMDSGPARHHARIVHVQGRVAALQVPAPSRRHAVSGLVGRVVDEAEGPLLARVGGAQPLR